MVAFTVLCSSGIMVGAGEAEAVTDGVDAREDGEVVIVRAEGAYAIVYYVVSQSRQVRGRGDGQAGDGQAQHRAVWPICSIGS